jgi:hypothetical protein
LSRTLGTPTSGTTWTWSAWVKRGSFAATQGLQHGFSANNNGGGILFSSDALHVYDFPTSTNCSLITTALFRDASAWYHIVIQVDTTQPTPSNRVRVYVNGVQITIFSTATYPGINTVFRMVASGNSGSVGRYFDGTNYLFDGYLTDVNFIDGQALTPASFGAIDSSTGVWAPRPYSGTYGANGFYLKFGNTSSVAALGTDNSGNGNTWTVNNVSLTAGATYDSMLDVPVNYADGGNGRGNYAVWNAVGKTGSAATTNGNLGNSFTSSSSDAVLSSIAIDIKAYAEFYGTAFGSAVRYTGVSESVTSLNNVLYYSDGRFYVNNVLQGTFATYTSADTVSVDCDPATRQARVYKNNTQISTTATIAGTLPLFFIAGGSGGGTGSSTGGANFGQRPFAYTPPAGFRALNTNNLPTPSIVNGANFMAATTYTGNAAARSLSNAVNSVSFQPDLVWIKNRTAGTFHALFDSARGATRYLSSNTTALEALNANTLTAFTADGFSLGNDTTLVNSGTGGANSYVAWQWKAGGAAVSNTQGTITSQVSANTTAGFSVVTYTGNGTAGATIGHGLGTTPSMIIVKSRNEAKSGGAWPTWHKSLANTNTLYLDQTFASTTYLNRFDPTGFTSSVFKTGANGGANSELNTLNNTLVAYCFAEIAGFSKFGSYTGNGLPDGPFVFCGFRPRFVMVKRTNTTGNWALIDSSRSLFNAASDNLYANLGDFETSVARLDTLSNGFKIRTTGGDFNGVSGDTYIFAAFAEVPSKYALAR